MKRTWAVLALCTVMISGLVGCSQSPSAPPAFVLDWKSDQGTWTVGETATMIVSVQNPSGADRWISIKPFGNDCFSCKGFGFWIDGWSGSGTIPADGKPHPVTVTFTPRAACPAGDYYFFVESRADANQAVADAEFSTSDDGHKGSKTFRVTVSAGR